MTSTTSHPQVGILSDAQTEKRAEIIELLTRAYWMEAETVLSYLANAANLDGIRAEEIAEALFEDVNEELGHARQFAERASRSSTARLRARSTSRPSRHRCSPARRPTCRASSAA